MLRFIKNNRAIYILLMVVLIFASPLICFADISDGYTYENPKDIIINAPGNTYTTTSSKVSIYGACDYYYPLFMNENKIEYSEHGFFVQYVDLKVGTNIFTFTNNDKSKDVVITRKSKGASSSGSGVNPSGDMVVPVSVPKYLTVQNHNSSHMSKPDGDDNFLLIPLAKGTTAQILGESKDHYLLSDGTYTYKSSMTIKDGILPVASVTDCQFEPLTDKACTQLKFGISQNSLYNIEMYKKYGVLTIYNAVGNPVLPEITDNKVIKSVKLLSNVDNKLVYGIEFVENPSINGCFVEFGDGEMTVGFKQLPHITTESLAGATIYVDAGHGGSDTGALGPARNLGPTEAEINLSISVVVKEYLESRGAKVITTRLDDKNIGLSTRAEIAAMEKPDLCVSIHNNSLPVTTNYNKANGIETFYSFSGNAAKNINASIISSMGMNYKHEKYKNLAMTRMIETPALLVECAFLSNPADYEFIIKKENQDKYGMAIGKGIENYIHSLAEEGNAQLGIPVNNPDFVEVIKNGRPIMTEQPALIKNGRTLVPLRAIFEAFGADVNWNNDTQTVFGKLGDTEIELSIGSPNIIIKKAGQNQATVQLDEVAQIVANRTMVPVRAISESFDAKVDWDNSNRQVIITNK